MFLKSPCKKKLNRLLYFGTYYSLTLTDFIMLVMLTKVRFILLVVC